MSVRATICGLRYGSLRPTRCGRPMSPPPRVGLVRGGAMPCALWGPASTRCIAAPPRPARTAPWCASPGAAREKCSRAGARSWASPSGAAEKAPSSIPARTHDGTPPRSSTSSRSTRPRAPLWSKTSGTRRLASKIWTTAHLKSPHCATRSCHPYPSGEGTGRSNRPDSARLAAASGCLLAVG